ncbi:hypothetical protein KR222_003477, partial [Zaprionus bogoriensis]
SRVSSKAEPINFLFDIIVSRLALDSETVENPAGLTVNVKFNKIPINITKSRINVSEFVAGKRTEFKAEAVSLRHSLEQSGMPLAVRYNGATLGTAEVNFSPEFLDRIEPNMNDLIHAQVARIKRKDEEIGTVELLCFLVAKCDEPEDAEPDTAKKTCRNLGTSLNPADIMFTFGTPQPCAQPAEPCMDELPPNEGDERLRLDIERYKSFNLRAIDEPREALGNDTCSELKKVTLQCGTLIDSIVHKMGHMPSPLPDDGAQFTDWSGKPKPHKVKYVDRTIPVPVGDIEERGIKPIRFCPICLTAMSWLPKYAPCPSCNSKPMPEIDDNDVKLTADQIIQQYLKLPAKRDDDDDFCHDPCKPKDSSETRLDGAGTKDPSDAKMATSRSKKDTCKSIFRCTCKAGRMCAHCRVRNLCTDIFKRKKNGAADCPSGVVNEQDDFCVVVDDPEEECRPYLERVFAELRDLYDKRDARKSDDFNKRCTQSVLKIRPSKGNGKENEQLADGDATTAGIMKNVGSPSFMSRAPQPKIGHKGCLRPSGTVSRRHGWNWPSSRKARKYGWRPGAICRYVGEIMKFFLQRSAGNNAMQTCRRIEDQCEQEDGENPILNVCKRDGAIYITLRAVKSPGIDMKPIVFKIVKSDLAKALSRIKRNLKKSGFRKCTCHRSLMLCVCRKHKEKKELELALQKECKRIGAENLVDHLVLTDTSDSDMDFNFDVSPPAATRTPLLAIKPRVINKDTQTNKGDLDVTPLYPVIPDPYWRAYDCAAGDRYTGTAFGVPGEEVFEDGIFGFGGGGPHGHSAAPGGRGKPPGVWGGGTGGPM